MEDQGYELPGDVRDLMQKLHDQSLEILKLRAENAEIRKWLDGCRLIISNMQPKEVPND